MQTLTQANLKAFFDANPSIYKSTWNGIAPLGDGYLPTVTLNVVLCQPSQVSNPSPQGQVPVPFTVAGVFSAITGADSVGMNNALQIVDAPFYGELVSAIQANNIGDCSIWLTVVNAKGWLTPAEEQALVNLLTATKPDPNWPATVPGPSPLEANFTDGGGVAHDRLEDYAVPPLNACAFIAAALGRSWPQ